MVVPLIWYAKLQKHVAHAHGNTSWAWDNPKLAREAAKKRAPVEVSAA